MKKYRIVPCYDNFPESEMSFQLIRNSDDAILCSYSDVNDIFIMCWIDGIPAHDVVIL